MQALGPAMFLACSWFWCIGGFFPVLLERDFGWPALAFFALFNIAGATLFGWVWTSETRKQFLTRMRGYAEAFSAIVIGYHLVFICWLSILLADSRPLFGFLVLVALLSILRRRLMVLAAPVLVLTAVLFAALFFLAEPRNTAPAIEQAPFLHQILPLALGFLLAPAFDLTFHRAYAASTRPRQTFVIAFGVIFAALLAGMMLNLPVFAELLAAPHLSHPTIAIAVTLLVLQTAYTTAAHVRELSGTAWTGRQFWVPTVVIVMSLAGLHAVVDLTLPDWGKLFGETTYRGFVFVIGAIFPTLLIFDGLNRRSVGVIAVLIPCYTLGFLIGGPLAPFLSVAMVALAMAYWWQRRQSPATPSAQGRG